MTVDSVISASNQSIYRSAMYVCIGLAGKTSWDTAIVDSIVDSVTEIREKSYDVHFEKDEAKKVRHQL